MTYCVALRLNRGLVFAADTRTNAGVDNIAQFRKIHYWCERGDRVIVLLAAGNLSLTQSVVSVLNEQLLDADPEKPNLLNVQSMYRAARLVGDAVRSVRSFDGPALDLAKTSFAGSFILGGQIKTEPPRLFQIYPEGNFIEATDDTPYFQIGEHKYGKPILDRVAQPTMRLGEAAKLILLSFDFDAALQSLGRHADRHSRLRARQPRFAAREADRQGQRVFQEALECLVGGTQVGIHQDRRIRRLSAAHCASRVLARMRARRTMG